MPVSTPKEGAVTKTAHLAPGARLRVLAKMVASLAIVRMVGWSRLALANPGRSCVPSVAAVEQLLDAFRCRPVRVMD